MTPHQLMVDILNHACVSQELDDGWREYEIEVHCVAFTVEAKPRRGIYQMDGTLPTDWEIRSVKRVSV